MVGLVEASKEVGYRADHVRELCRAGLVKCEKVGWYWNVDLESLRNHKAISKPGPRSKSEIDGLHRVNQVAK